MNIIVKTFGSDLCHCRPDTTWERENRDFYSPECVNKVLWTPVVFARISKAGKCIGEKFAGRYYDSIGCGILMYCEVDSNIGPAISACVDHTSILPMPLYDPMVLESDENFVVTRNSESITTERSEWRDLLCKALCTASQLTSLRTGDYVAVEIAPQTTLASREDGTVPVKGTFCEKEIFNFRIIF